MKVIGRKLRPVRKVVPIDRHLTLPLAKRYLATARRALVATERRWEQQYAALEQEWRQMRRERDEATRALEAMLAERNRALAALLWQAKRNLGPQLRKKLDGIVRGDE